MKPSSVEAASLSESQDGKPETETDSDSETALKPSKKAKIGFRERKIIEYENRIRHYSTP